MTVCGTRWTRRVERNEWSEGDGERAEHDGRNRKGIDQRRRIDERERERGWFWNGSGFDGTVFGDGCTVYST